MSNYVNVIVHLLHCPEKFMCTFAKSFKFTSRLCFHTPQEKPIILTHYSSYSNDTFHGYSTSIYCWIRNKNNDESKQCSRILNLHEQFRAIHCILLIQRFATRWSQSTSIQRVFRKLKRNRLVGLSIHSFVRSFVRLSVLHPCVRLNDSLAIRSKTSRLFLDRNYSRSQYLNI